MGTRGQPTRRAMAKTSKPQASMAGRAWRGWAHSPPLTTAQPSGVQVGGLHSPAAKPGPGGSTDEGPPSSRATSLVLEFVSTWRGAISPTKSSTPRANGRAPVSLDSATMRRVIRGQGVWGGHMMLAAVVLAGRDVAPCPGRLPHLQKGGGTTWDRVRQLVDRVIGHRLDGAEIKGMSDLIEPFRPGITRAPGRAPDRPGRYRR